MSCIRASWVGEVVLKVRVRVVEEGSWVKVRRANILWVVCAALLGRFVVLVGGDGRACCVSVGFW